MKAWIIKNSDGQLYTGSFFNSEGRKHYFESTKDWGNVVVVMFFNEKDAEEVLAAIQETDIVCSLQEIYI